MGYTLVRVQTHLSIQWMIGYDNQLRIFIDLRQREDHEANLPLRFIGDFLSYNEKPAAQELGIFTMG